MFDQLSKWLAGIGNGGFQQDGTGAVPPVAGGAGVTPPAPGMTGSPLQGLATLFEGLGSGVQAYGSLKNIGLAKDTLNFQKQAYKTNLGNQTQSYNTALENRTRAKYFAEGKDTSAADAYLAKHSL